MKKDPIKWQKHLEVCKRWRERNPEKTKEVSRLSAQRRRDMNPKKWKETMNERAKRYRLENLEQAKLREKEKSRLRRESNPQKEKKDQRDYYLKRYYKMSQEDYDKMFLNQEGKCAFCGMKDVKLFIDHCHKKEDIRGLLCSPCNLALGHIERMIEKNPDIFKLIPRYLKLRSTKTLK